MLIYKDDSDEGEKDVENKVETRKAAIIPKKKAKAPYKSMMSGSDNDSVDPSFGVQASKILFKFHFFNVIFVIFLHASNNHYCCYDDHNVNDDDNSSKSNNFRFNSSILQFPF